MADNSVENNSGSQAIEQQIEQKLKAQSAEQLKAEFEGLASKVSDAKNAIKTSLNNPYNPQTQHTFGGDKNDKDSPYGRAVSIKEFIQKMFYAAQGAPEKIPTAEKKVQTDPKVPVPTPESTLLLKRLSKNIPLSTINEQNAPYFYDLVNSIVNGRVKSAEDFQREVKNAEDLMRSSPTVFKKLQEVGVDYAVNEYKIPEKDANEMFGIEEATPERQQNNIKAREEAVTMQNFEDSWRQNYSSYFDDVHDKGFIKALYTPKGFIEYYEGVQHEVKLNNPSFTKNEVAQRASLDMERKVTELFGKLYSKLDHESPKEFFQAIEQEDIMRGIVPVKSELKRRIERLAGGLHDYEHEMHAKGQDIAFFRRLEESPGTVTINVNVGGQDSLKPRPRLKSRLTPEKSSGGEFAHYLEQIADHYIEARKFTHNARAIFLHPVDGSKGFYEQLAHFAAESSMLDFDQMMLLPDNDVFQSAFGLYNKMVEEEFAKFDWRHTASMFTPLENEHLNPIEKRVMGQLKMMYGDNHISEERLSAALTMAVGASRGMFLTEVEMAAHADPHLDEKGGATFTSYYNQDATALMAFNPQHLMYRFHGSPSMLDPIFFLPVDGFKGTQAFNDHNTLWDKAKYYKESFVKGRARLDGQTTFFDMLDNIGLVGGPMQRKGWRTSWQLNSLYVLDPITSKQGGKEVIHQKTNHVKTFKYFENIGYEILQDYVSKLDEDFAKVRNTPLIAGDAKRLAEQKKELFEYIFVKYFNKEPKDLNTYLDVIRKEKRNATLSTLRKGGTLGGKSVDETAEIATSKAFLDRMLARVIVKRLPSKLLSMDRDRYSEKGISRYKQMRMNMGMADNFDAFDKIMQDMILAEQMMRRDTSTKMRAMRDADKNPEMYGALEYKVTAKTLTDVLSPLVKQGKMSQERLDNVLKLYGLIETNYINNDAFIDKELVPYFKNGGAIDRKSKYTIALDETDLSFIPFRGGGQSVLKRALGDINSTEQNLVKPIGEFVKKIRDMAINGKKDFSPIIEIIGKVWGSMDGIIGFPYANELASKLASMTIMYMKKDTQARALMGVGGLNRFNSMAAESAGKKVGVWEWDSADIDRFVTALETGGFVPPNPYNIGAEPGRAPVYINTLFSKNPIKLPEKIALTNIAKFFGIEGGEIKNPFNGKIMFTIKDIPLFTKQEHNFHGWTSKDLRKNFGGTKFDMLFDIMNKYLPAFLIFILLAQLKKAFEDSEGKKK